MAAESFWSIKLSDIINSAILLATIAAIVLGPVLAVKVSIRREEAREVMRRKYAILITLMRTRRMYMHVDHVGALNAVQLVFYRDQAVLSAFRSYITNLNEPIPNPGKQLEHFIERRNDLFIELLFAICEVVGSKIDKRDLEKLAYVPAGWATEEEQTRIFRQGMIEVLNGRRPLPITAFTAPGSSVYPPPPTGG